MGRFKTTRYSASYSFYCCSIFGLFSVPAPLFRTCVNGGVFLLADSINTSPQTAMWNLHNSVARLESSDILAALDIEKPYEGLYVERACVNRALGARILRLNASQDDDIYPAVQEYYARGKDVVATYTPTRTGAVRAQVYWRYHQFDVEQGPAVGVELIVSMQTSLLDSDPSASVITSIPCDEVWACELDDDASQFERLQLSIARPTVWTEKGSRTVHLFRPQNRNVSYVEVVHEEDGQLARMELAAGSRPTVHCETSLFGEPLEKGVIRRGRVWGMFVPRSNDFDAALTCLREIAAAPLPLTT